MSDSKKYIFSTVKITKVIQEVRECDFKTSPKELKKLLNDCSMCFLGEFETTFHKQLRNAEDRIFMLLSMKYDIKKFHFAVLTGVVGWLLAIILFLIKFLSNQTT